MQILTERPTEDGQYVMLWQGAGALWCNQIRIENGEMTRRISSTASAFSSENWAVVNFDTDNRTFPRTFLKL